MKNISLYFRAFLIASILNISVFSFAMAGDEEKGIAAVINLVKQATVFIGRQEQQKDGTLKNVYKGTGCIILIDGFSHVLTAKHVIAQNGTPADDMKFFLNRMDGIVSAHSFEEIKKKYDVEWIFPQDPDIDLAIIPVALDSNQDLFKVMSPDIFKSSDELYELYDVFFLSYQPGAVDDNVVSPIVRAATVSLIRKDGTYLIDGNAFPGNSGSPVFLKPSAIRHDSGKISYGYDPLGGRFIGIIGSYLTYREVAVSKQTGRSRVVFEENTGLSRVSSVELIQDLIKSESFRAQIKKLKKKDLPIPPEYN